MTYNSLMFDNPMTLFEYTIETKNVPRLKTTNGKRYV